MRATCRCCPPDVRIFFTLPSFLETWKKLFSQVVRVVHFFLSKNSHGFRILEAPFTRFCASNRYDPYGVCERMRLRRHYSPWSALSPQLSASSGFLLHFFPDPVRQVHFHHMNTAVVACLPVSALEGIQNKWNVILKKKAKISCLQPSTPFLEPSFRPSA